MNPSRPQRECARCAGRFAGRMMHVSLVSHPVSHGAPSGIEPEAYGDDRLWTRRRKDYCCAACRFLPQSDLLRRCRRARQESGQIGTNLGTADDDDASEQKCEPGADHPACGQAHDSSSVIVITERFPSVSMISIVRIRFLLPPMRISLTIDCIFGSAGVSDKRH